MIEYKNLDTKKLSVDKRRILNFAKSLFVKEISLSKKLEKNKDYKLKAGERSLMATMNYAYVNAHKDRCTYVMNSAVLLKTDIRFNQSVGFVPDLKSRKLDYDKVISNVTGKHAELDPKLLSQLLTPLIKNKIEWCHFYMFKDHMIVTQNPRINEEWNDGAFDKLVVFYPFGKETHFCLNINNLNKSLKLLAHFRSNPVDITIPEGLGNIRLVGNECEIILAQYRDPCY